MVGDPLPDLNRERIASKIPWAKDWGQVQPGERRLELTSEARADLGLLLHLAQSRCGAGAHLIKHTDANRVELWIYDPIGLAAIKAVVDEVKRPLSRPVAHFPPSIHLHHGHTLP